MRFSFTMKNMTVACCHRMKRMDPNGYVTPTRSHVLAALSVTISPRFSLTHPTGTVHSVITLQEKAAFTLHNITYFAFKLFWIFLKSTRSEIHWNSNKVHSISMRSPCSFSFVGMAGHDMAAPEMDCPGDALLPNGTGHGPCCRRGRFFWMLEDLDGSTWLFLAAGAMGQHNFPVRNFWVTLVKLLRPECSRIFEIFQNFGDVESSRFLLQRNIYGMSLEYLWNMTGTGDFKSNLPFTCWDNSIWESLHYTYFHHYYPNQDHNHYHYRNCYHYH